MEDYTDNDNKVIKNGLFIIEKVEKADAGTVTCIGEELETSESSSCTLHVKGKIYFFIINALKIFRR